MNCCSIVRPLACLCPTFGPAVRCASLSRFRLGVGCCARRAAGSTLRRPAVLLARRCLRGIAHGRCLGNGRILHWRRTGAASNLRGIGRGPSLQAGKSAALLGRRPRGQHSRKWRRHLFAYAHREPRSTPRLEAPRRRPAAPAQILADSALHLPSEGDSQNSRNSRRATLGKSAHSFPKPFARLRAFGSETHSRNSRNSSLAVSDPGSSLAGDRVRARPPCFLPCPFRLLGPWHRQPSRPVPHRRRLSACRHLGGGLQCVARDIYSEGGSQNSRNSPRTAHGESAHSFPKPFDRLRAFGSETDSRNSRNSSHATHGESAHSFPKLGAVLRDYPETRLHNLQNPSCLARRRARRTDGVRPWQRRRATASKTRRFLSGDAWQASENACGTASRRLALRFRTPAGRSSQKRFAEFPKSSHGSSGCRPGGRARARPPCFLPCPFRLLGPSAPTAFSPRPSPPPPVRVPPPRRCAPRAGSDPHAISCIPSRKCRDVPIRARKCLQICIIMYRNSPRLRPTRRSPPGLALLFPVEGPAPTSRVR